MDARPASVWRGAAKNDHSARHSLVCPVVLLRALSRPQTRLARGVVPTLVLDAPASTSTRPPARHIVGSSPITFDQRASGRVGNQT